MDHIEEAIKAQLEKQGKEGLTAEQVEANAALDAKLQGEGTASPILGPDGEPVAREYTPEEEMAMEQNWQQLTKKVGMPDFIDDQIRRGLGIFMKRWNDSRPDDQIGFGLHLRQHRTNGGVIGSVSLALELKRDNKFQTIREKVVNFKHVKEMRHVHEWKMALYEAMLHDLISMAASHMIFIDEGRKSTPEQTV